MTLRRTLIGLAIAAIGSGAAVADPGHGGGPMHHGSAANAEACAPARGEAGMGMHGGMRGGAMAQRDGRDAACPMGAQGDAAGPRHGGPMMHGRGKGAGAMHPTGGDLPAGCRGPMQAH